MAARAACFDAPDPSAGSVFSGRVLVRAAKAALDCLLRVHRNTSGKPSVPYNACLADLAINGDVSKTRFLTDAG
jgi:hypothetical protein